MKKRAIRLMIVASDCIERGDWRNADRAMRLVWRLVEQIEKRTRQ